VLLVVSSIKLVAEIALMALAGQFVLGLLAGAKREQNFMYRMFQVLTSPFVKAVRFITPRVVIDRHIPLATFVLFYLMTVFALSWGTTALGYPREQFLWLQMLGVLCFAATIPVAAVLADRRGRRLAMLAVTAAIFVFGLAFERLFVTGSPAGALLFLALGLGLMGFTYGPLGTVLAELFPAPVRYSGTSLAFNLSGILGASLAPYIAIRLATQLGLAWVGYYLALAAVLSFAALLAARPHPEPGA